MPRHVEGHGRRLLGGYQVGIVGYGKGDNIVNNKVSGIGYNQSHAPIADSFYAQFDIDQPNAHFHNNS